MLDKIIDRLAGQVVTRITQELLDRLPEIIEQAVRSAITALPDTYEGLADQIIDRITARLPFPFKK